MAKRHSLKAKKRLGKKKASAAVQDRSVASRRSAARRHRQVIYLNDNELAAVRLYCDRYRVRSRSALFREAVMSAIISVIDENQPTLF